MDLFEFLWGEQVLTLEGFECVGQLKFLEKPEDALRAGLFEPGKVELIR